MIKIRKDNKPNRPVFTSIHAPSYKLTKFIRRDFSELIELPYTFSTKNSRQLAQEQATIQFNNSKKNYYFRRQKFICKSSYAGYIKDHKFMVQKK